MSWLKYDDYKEKKGRKTEPKRKQESKKLPMSNIQK
jgi:hypothetical protein